jgi:hypothetical protein
LIERVATNTSSERGSNTVLRPEFVSFSSRRNHARLYWKRFCARVPNKRTPGWLSSYRKPRKSVVNGWMPTRSESKS